jgi:hypothetical protein
MDETLFVDVEQKACDDFAPGPSRHHEPERFRGERGHGGKIPFAAGLEASPPAKEPPLRAVPERLPDSTLV